MELIVQDMAGVHNKDLKATGARLIKGATWKQQRIIVIIPSAATVPAKVVLSWMNLAYPPNNGVMRILALGDEVGVAYSQAIEQVLAHPELSKWEYILTMEHDNLVPADGVLKLIEQMEAHPEFACIGGLYFTKGLGGVAQIWGDPRGEMNFRPQIPIPNALQECCGTGMGFNLWRLSMFKDPKLRRPWFKTQTKDGCATQDLYFWSDARRNGYRCAIDTSIRVGHYDFEGKFGPPDTVW